MATWLAYLEVEPFGGAQDDLRAARVAEAVYATRGVKVAPGQLFPSLGSGASAQRRQSREEQVKVVGALKLLLCGGRK